MISEQYIFGTKIIFLEPRASAALCRRWAFKTRRGGRVQFSSNQLIELNQPTEPSYLKECFFQIEGTSQAKSEVTASHDGLEPPSGVSITSLREVICWFEGRARCPEGVQCGCLKMFDCDAGRGHFGIRNVRSRIGPLR